MKIKFSLKTKLLSLITALICGPMAYLLYHTIVIQKQEILNSSYEKQSMELKLAAEKFSNVVKTSFSTLKLANSASDVESLAQYKTYLDSLISGQGREISNLFILEVPIKNIEGLDINKLYQNKDNQVVYLKNNSLITENLEQILNKSSLITKFSETEILVAIADMNYSPNMDKILLISAIVDISSLFKQSESWILIANENGEDLFSTSSEVISSEFKDQLTAQSMGVNTFEWQENGKTFLTSVLGSGGYKVVIKQDLQQLLIPVYDSMQKIILIFLIALSVGTGISVAFTKKLVSPMEELCSTTELIGKGNFDIKVMNKSNDEVGVLAHSIENMTLKIRNLMKDNEDKVRLENELNMAAKLQKDSLPKDKMEESNFLLLSHNLQASECGGDWWGNYSLGNKLVVMIGDATGHGLGSAMVTVTAKTVKSTAKQKNITDPNEILKMLNQAIFETSGGSILMTFFVATIDFDKNTIEYANAGHNTPWLFKKDGEVEALTFKGIRLGEQESFDPKSTKTTSFIPGDLLFLYTDGLIETNDIKGNTFGKNQVRKLISSEISKGTTKTYNKLKFMFNSFLGTKKNPDDDATFVFLEYKDLNTKQEVA